ncbi:MAG: DUF669 domain-containing protein [Proteobacteria bacterium]|nr:DUF669 domain-containing protein [Pseudomonadota bacterium]
MAFLGEVFNLDDMPRDEPRGFEPIPAGWYTAAIVGADVKTTKAGNGSYIALRLDITGPSHQGRVLWSNINTRNPNLRAEEIGRGQLGQIMAIIGLASIEDSDQLIGGNLAIKVTVRDDSQYGPGNEVKGFKAIEGSGSALPKAAPATTAPANGKAAPPWASK